jgi:isopenicillin N synthase-like dioxygenase
VASFQRYGFVRLVNHSIPEPVIVDMFTRSTNFFQLSPARKIAMAHPRGPKPQRGWSRVGDERTAKLFRHGASGCDEMIDAREHFDQGSPLDQEWPNLWPSEDDVPGFRATMEAFYCSAHAVAQTLILPALEEGLGLEPGVLTGQCQGLHSELRLNHYPSIRLGDLRGGNISRIHPHTDLGVVTCLFQHGGVGGLEARDYKTGRWVPLATESISEMVVNISETLERWTNGQVRAGVHQVTILPALQDELDDEKSVPPRFSTAFFLKADRHACVGALPSFVSEQCPRKFEDMTALEYHQQRLATAY